MILVACSVVDDAAARLAEEIRGFAAASVLTCRDLALGKCAIRHPEVAASVITVDGRSVTPGELRGVLNLLPAVFPDELYFYPDAEREYQAAEFHALLTFLLAALPCPVVNRPTATGLTGPYSGRTAWFHLAKSVEVPVVDVRLSSDEWAKPAEANGELTEVACLQGQVLGPADDVTADYVGRIRAAAGVEYVRATFVWCDREPALFSVSTMPNLRDAATRNALRQLSQRWAKAQ